VIVGTYFPTRPTLDNRYFDIPDDAVLTYLFGDTEATRCIGNDWKNFMIDVDRLHRRYISASHRLVPAELLELRYEERNGCPIDYPVEVSRVAQIDRMAQQVQSRFVRRRSKRAARIHLAL
jgi:hypothetical protein